MCTHIYTNTYIHTHRNTLILTYTHAHTYIHTEIHTHIHTHTYTDIHAYTHTYTAIHTHTYTPYTAGVKDIKPFRFVLSILRACAAERALRTHCSDTAPVFGCAAENEECHALCLDVQLRKRSATPCGASLYTASLANRAGLPCGRVAGRAGLGKTDLVTLTQLFPDASTERNLPAWALTWQPNRQSWSRHFSRTIRSSQIKTSHYNPTAFFCKVRK